MRYKINQSSKTSEKNPNTANLHPRQIFIDNILAPMRLNPEDEQKVTPITVIDVNKEKPDQSSHLLICTFSSIQAISLLKQNARKIPRAVKFNTRVPTLFQPTLNEHLRIQGQLRQMRNHEGSPLVKTRLNTDRGHILLEVADRVGDGWSPFRTRTAFMPQSRMNLPQTTTTSSPPKIHSPPIQVGNPPDHRSTELLKTATINSNHRKCLI